MPDGLPVRIVLTAGPGLRQDRCARPARWLAARRDVVADRGYDATPILDLIRRAGADAHIPSHAQRIVRRSVDMAIYRQRNLVERFFCKLKHFRRVATRFDKLARNFLAAVLLASARLWIRVYEFTT